MQKSLKTRLWAGALIALSVTLLSGCLPVSLGVSFADDISLEDTPHEIAHVAPAIAYTSERAWNRLMEGNQRFYTGHLEHIDQSLKTLHDIAPAQHPFAVVIACSDSRVVPEVIFDQGLGDIFDIRVAGNIADDAVIGSIEYAVEHLHVPLIVVMSHQRCGAVTAAVEHASEHNHMDTILHEIEPALKQAETLKGDLIDNTSRCNAQLVASQLAQSAPVLKQAIDSGQLKIVAAHYHLDSGRVDLLTSTP